MSWPQVATILEALAAAVAVLGAAIVVVRFVIRRLRPSRGARDLTRVVMQSPDVPDYVRVDRRGTSGESDG